MQRPFTYVYLISVEHSGSTLIALLLGPHSQVSTVGEFGSNFKNALRCSCGGNYNTCAFWKEWRSAAEQRGIDFEIGQLGINCRPGESFFERLFYHQFRWPFLNFLRNSSLRLWPQPWRACRRALQKSTALAELLCEMEETDVFLDTTKNHWQIRFLRQYSRVNLKMIVLVRDGRGVMNSLVEKENYTPEQAVLTWLWGNRNMERAAAHFMSEAEVFRLRLEDLCVDPEGTMRALCQFLEIDADQKLDYADRSSRHIVGNDARHVFDGKIRLDESWRRTLSAENRAFFEQRAGWLNRRYGYGD